MELLFAILQIPQWPLPREIASRMLTAIQAVGACVDFYKNK